MRFNQSFLQNLFRYGKRSIYYPGFTIIPSNRFMDANAFLGGTTNLSAWNVFSGTYANGATISGWSGANNLTVMADGGGLGTTTDHLGSSNALDFDGTNDGVFVNNTNFNTTNESLSAYGWFKSDARSITYETLVAKYDGTSGNDSFYLRINPSGALEFLVRYNTGGSDYQALVTEPIIAINKWYFFAIVYDQTAQSMMLTVNGKCYGYINASALATRNNNNNTKLSWGCTGNGTVLGWAFNGKLADIGYQKVALTANQIRRLYAQGCQFEATLGMDSKVVVKDGSMNTGIYYRYPTSTITVTATAVGTALSGYTAYAFEDGLYRARVELFGRAQEVNDDPAICTIFSRLIKSSGAEIPGAYFRMTTNVDYDAESPTTSELVMKGCIEKLVYLTKDTGVGVEAWKSGNTNTAYIEYSNDEVEPYIMLEKLE